jgi:copper(I)-binding protein
MLLPTWQRRGPAAVALAAVLVAAPLGACSRERADSGAPAASTGRTLDSVDGQVGSIRVLHAYVATPGERGATHTAEDGAELLLTVANDGAAADELVAVTSDAADEVLFRDGDADPTAELAVEVPPGGVAVLRDVDGTHLELAGLREELRSGSRLAVTFEFRDAGPVTLQVPVATYVATPRTSAEVAAPS